MIMHVTSHAGEFIFRKNCHSAGQKNPCFMKHELNIVCQRIMFCDS